MLEEGAPIAVAPEARQHDRSVESTGEGDAECQLLPEGVHKVHMLSATGMRVFRAPGKRGRQRAGLCVLVVQHEEALSVCLVPERRGCHRVAIDEPQPPHDRRRRSRLEKVQSGRSSKVNVACTASGQMPMVRCSCCTKKVCPLAISDSGSPPRRNRRATKGTHTSYTRREPLVARPSRADGLPNERPSFVSAGMPHHSSFWRYQMARPSRVMLCRCPVPRPRHRSSKTVCSFSMARFVDAASATMRVHATHA